MIPLRDNQPTTTFPIITILLIAVNIAVYALQQTVGDAVNNSWSMIPFQVAHNQDIGQSHYFAPPAGSIDVPGMTLHYALSPHPLWITIFTSMFMHANLLHLGGNMLYLWIFGNNIEDALGKVRYLFFYFACGLAAATAQIMMDPNSLIPTLGASGAIAGVLGAYYLLYPDARVLSIIPIGFAFIAEVRAAWVLGLWIVIQVFQGVFGLGGQATGGVAYFAHIGGFLAGLILIKFMGGMRLVKRQRQRTYYTPPPSGGGYY